MFLFIRGRKTRHYQRQSLYSEILSERGGFFILGRDRQKVAVGAGGSAAMGRILLYNYQFSANDG